MLLRTNYYFPVFFYSHGIQCFTICRYFDALSKGETPPVKDRLEFQLGQPLQKPLTQGLLAVLHKQVFSLLSFSFNLQQQCLDSSDKQNLSQSLEVTTGKCLSG